METQLTFYIALLCTAVVYADEVCRAEEDEECPVGLPLCAEVHEWPCACCPEAGYRAGDSKPGSDWPVVSPDVPVEIFAAHWDPRRPSSNTIRVTAHGLQTEFREVPGAVCHIRTSIGVLYLGEAEYVRLYRSGAHPDEYTAHQYLCSVPVYIDVKDIQSVAISDDVCDVSEEASATVPLIQPPPSTLDVKGKLGACVSPIYGKYQPLLLAEYVELHRILGFHHFTFYLHQVAPNLLPLLRHYQSIKVATLVQWPLHKPQGRTYCYYDQRSALNDCLYRSLGRFEYVAFMDLDEVIVPKSTDTVPQLIEKLQRENEGEAVGSLCFQHVFFKENTSDPESKAPLPLRTQSRFSRTVDVYPTGKIRSKCVHAPGLTVETDIHFAKSWLNSSILEVVLEPGDGILHHYREIALERIWKEPELHPFAPDYALKAHQPQLILRVRRALIAAGIPESLWTAPI